MVDEAAQNEQSGDLEVGPGVFLSPAAMRFQFARSGGPGGQNVNKLNTKAELWFDPVDLRGMHPEAVGRLRDLAGRRLTKEGEIHIVAETARTQEGNRAAVLEKLREMIVRAQHRPKVRRKTRPSKAAKERRLQAKKRRGEIKAKRRGPME
ncbi:MAG TPA: alternative ribosome rescue aminoacyl-tRNA hydrolase ArfB [Tepidisphaeraceae bacterium]|jgi:ribosome-associated protein|nr:alternative ribosome rescue aminoacyl-tRNA hydrolase ArfB [Tepidisphaeraceae bacterium]